METPNKIKPLNKMTKVELKDWIDWAENEISEYRDFVRDLKIELKKRICFS